MNINIAKYMEIKEHGLENTWVKEEFIIKYKIFRPVKVITKGIFIGLNA